jgi:hypothetical protein
MSRADAAAARHFVRWTPPGPGLVLLLWWPQRPRSAVALALRTRPCHTGTRVRPRLSTPAIFHPMPTAARRPAAAGYRWPAVHPVTPSARPGMTHREERGPCAGGLKHPAEYVLPVEDTFRVTDRHRMTDSVEQWNRRPESVVLSGSDPIAMRAKTRNPMANSGRPRGAPACTRRTRRGSCLAGGAVTCSRLRVTTSDRPRLRNPPCRVDPCMSAQPNWPDFASRDRAQLGVVRVSAAQPTARPFTARTLAAQ